MKLSIVIPVYRAEATLERCLGSVIGQTFSDFEVILVDDGSPDGCPEMCDEWAGRDSHISVIHKQNGGLSDARNAGIERATGEYITFVDSDVYLDAETYERVMAVAEGCDMVEYPIFCHYGGRHQQLLKPGEHAYERAEDYWLEGHAYEHSYACNKVYRRELFAGVSYPVGRVFEDMATLPQLVAKARCIRTTDGGCYYYVENDKGITATATGSQLEMLLEAHIEAMRRWTDDRYYMHVLNIQLDVARLTRKAPILPQRHIAWTGSGLSFRLRMKAWALNMFGINRLCKIHQAIRQRR